MERRCTHDILHPGQYLKHEALLTQDPSGLAPDITLRKRFELLQEDPEALLVLYFHGAAGTLGSGYRPPSYRAISTLDPQQVHIVALDYRGLGTSTGEPSRGRPSRGRSDPCKMGYGSCRDPTVKDCSLRPQAKFPKLLALLNKFIRGKWSSEDRVAGFVRSHETAAEPRPEYWINLIHAPDDYDIPRTHSEWLYWHAANATMPTGISYEDLERQNQRRGGSLGQEGGL